MAEKSKLELIVNRIIPGAGNVKTSPYESRPWVKHYPNGMLTDIDEFEFQNLVQLFQTRAKEYGDKDAFRLCLPDGDVGGLSYAELDQYSTQLAAYFHYQLDFGPGDRVAIKMPNCLAYPVVVLAIWKAGGVVVNMNPLLTTTELNAILKDSDARALVVLSQFRDKLEQATEGTSVRNVFEANLADFLSTWNKVKIKAYERFVERLPETLVSTKSLESAVEDGAALVQEHGDVAADIGGVSKLEDLAVLQYTGGTTGASKGAMLCQRNLLANIAQGSELLGQRHIEMRSMLMALPLYHIYAFGLMLGGMAWGSTSVLIPNPRPISNLRAAFEGYQFDFFAGVNTLFIKLMEQDWFVSNPCSDIRIVFAGGAALQDSVATTWVKVVGSEINQGYGLTECSPGVLANIPSEAVKRGTVGVPLPGTDVCLIDENGAEVPVGERGQLMVKGPQVMQGYWQQPEATAAVLNDGWLATGDIAIMDDDGFFRIVDRIDDMILVSGFNVYPNEVEAVVVKHPDVIDAGVVGIEDDDTGETVLVFVVPRTRQLTADSVRAFARQHLAAYKVPTQVILCPELPLSNVGKILRRELRVWVDEGRFQ